MDEDAELERSIEEEEARRKQEQERLHEQAHTARQQRRERLDLTEPIIDHDMDPSDG